MTIEPTPVRKTPWLAIILGVLAVLCLCAVVIGIAILAYFIPIRGSTTILETPSEVVIEPTVALFTPVPSEEPQEGTSLVPDAAPAGSTVDIGNDMTLTSSRSHARRMISWRTAVS